jgi:hypothetical protein
MCDRFYGSGEKETDGGFVSIFQIVWVGEDGGMLFRNWQDLVFQIAVYRSETDKPLMNNEVAASG